MKIKVEFTKRTLQIAIVTTVTVFAWLSFDVYRAYDKKIESKVLKEQMATLDPNINLEILDKLKNRLSPTAEDFQKIPNRRQIQFDINPGPETASPSASSEP